MRSRGDDYSPEFRSQRRGACVRESGGRRKHFRGGSGITEKETLRVSRVIA